MTSTRDEALAAARAHFDGGNFQADLTRRIAMATESQEPSQRQELYRYLLSEIGPWLRRYDFAIELFDNPDPAGGPFLLATRHEDDDATTLLTYGHGDVVRGIPEQWRDGLDPWTITVEDDRWYGRGTADNKGQHSIIMAALAQVIETRGRLGFNAKVLIETGEEIGSPGLRTFCEQQNEKLAADLFLASDGPRQSPGKADISLGNRGGISFDLIVNLREGSRHSGHYGGLIEDPGITLAHALATITDRRGRILVKDWLPTSVPDSVTEVLRALALDAGDASLVGPADWGEPGLTPAEKVLGWTGFIILAFITGRPENPVNGVQPEARARCQIRFTADVDEADLLPALRRHLDEQGFPQVEIRPAGHASFPAWRTDPDNPWVDWTLTSLTETLDYRPNLIPNSSGGLPSGFLRTLELPVIWIHALLWRLPSARTGRASPRRCHARRARDHDGAFLGPGRLALDLPLSVDHPRPSSSAISASVVT
ncbi:MAG: M20/M25/M40 family metallo-hydrolase [Alphaproteobacteria bacterium]